MAMLDLTVQVTLHAQACILLNCAETPLVESDVFSAKGTIMLLAITA